MRNLPPPSRDPAEGDLIKAIRQYRYRGLVRGHAITAAEVTAVLALYDQYDDGSAAPANALKGGALPQSLCDAIRDAYDATQEGRRLSSIRETVRRDVELCPVCGVDPAIELDHHLPRSVFKLLAIYARNLIPMCHGCNHAKCAHFGDDEEDTGFLNAYFHVLPNVDFLQAQVAIQDGGLIVDFGIDAHAALPIGFAARLTRQIDILGLNARYAWEINKYLSGQAIALHGEFYRGGAEAVRTYLSRLLSHATIAYYRNHWQPALLRALAGHDEFVDGGFATVFPVPQDILNDLLGGP